LGAALACGAAAGAQAAVSWNNVQFGGFISQGYLVSDGNNYPVETKEGTIDFREMGVNASTTFGQHLRVGAQLFAQKIGKYGDNEVVLDWAVLDYNVRQEFGVRVGRVKFPRSLQSEVLDADVLRPFIFLPQSLYDARLRDFQASFDGGMAYGTINAGKSSFDYKVYYGDIPMKTDSGVADFFNDSALFALPQGTTSLKLDSVDGATIAWNTPIPSLRFAAYYSALNHLKASGPFIAIPSLTTSLELSKAEYIAASAEYSWHGWNLVGEYLRERYKATLALPAFIAPPTQSKSGTVNYYVSVARHVTDKLELGTYFSNTHTGYPVAGQPSIKQKRNDWTVSGRYDLNDHLLFKLEVHFIRGTKDMFDLPGISNPPSQEKDATTLFAAKTTFSF
jgi:hypothetical protein